MDDFMAKMYTPPNPALNDYDDLIEYALTIDGYEYAEKVWGLDNTQDHWAKIQSFKKRAGGKAPSKICAAASLPISGASGGRKAALTTGRADGNL